MNFIKDYIKKEFSSVYPCVRRDIEKSYKTLCNSEKFDYVNSDEYKKLKKEEYWNRPRSVIEDEILQEELAKLDYWIPRQNPATQQSHITYTKNATDRFDDTTPIDFKPSITIQEFFKTEGIKIQEIVQHPSWVAFANAISNFMSFDEFVASLSESCFIDPNPTFYNDYINVMALFNIKSYFSEFGCKKTNIVTNGCKVVALRLEACKVSEIFIDIQKYPMHVHILGCIKDEIFRFPGIPDTYKIREIWK